MGGRPQIILVSVCVRGGSIELGQSELMERGGALTWTSESDLWGRMGRPVRRQSIVVSRRHVWRARAPWPSGPTYTGPRRSHPPSIRVFLSIFDPEPQSHPIPNIHIREGRRDSSFGFGRAAGVSGLNFFLCSARRPKPSGLPDWRTRTPSVPSMYVPMNCRPSIHRSIDRLIVPLCVSDLSDVRAPALLAWSTRGARRAPPPSTHTRPPHTHTHEISSARSRSTESTHKSVTP